jgi:type IV pilus assembly protein PilB
MDIAWIIQNNKFIKNFKNDTPQKAKKTEDLFAVSWTSSNSSNPNINSDLNINSYWDAKDDTWIIWIVNDMIIKSIILKASDIHIEPTEKDLRIRFRVDWNFVNYKNFNLNIKDSILARIKIRASLRIDEHRLPQDWKINYALFWWKDIDMRVSIVPTIYGEKCVLRLLKKDSKPPDLWELWIMPYNMVKIKQHLKDPYGMILAVWPTWSWKSTTLFSLLSQYNPEEKNISTLEDPVEYRIPWVNHIQIKPEIKFSFASWLRALLRQDPDIIMVWEIRDEETAKLAVEASITWHIVFSTLHTNSASHTLNRLVNLWIDPLLISSSLKMIISQRLARKLCVNCKISYMANNDVKSSIIWKVGKYIKGKENIKLYKAKEWWCEKCHNTWYNWRVWFYEILEMSDKIEALMLRNASRTEIEIQAIWEWMITIKEDWLIKVVLWDTSFEEMLSIVWS